MRKDFGRNNDQQGKIFAEKIINEETFWQKIDKRGNNSAEKLINEEFHNKIVENPR